MWILWDILEWDIEWTKDDIRLFMKKLKSIKDWCTKTISNLIK